MTARFRSEKDKHLLARRAKRLVWSEPGPWRNSLNYPRLLCSFSFQLQPIGLEHFANRVRTLR